MAEFAYNDTQHSTTGFTPFFLNLGWHLNRVPEGKPMKESPAADNFIKNLVKARERANEALHRVKEKMKETYDKKHLLLEQWTKGDYIWIDQ
jgi:hypothetical protein